MASRSVHVEGGVEHLGHAALDVHERVDGLHRGPHRVLGGEDAVALRRLGELADEGEVLRALRRHVRAVARGARHEECRDVGHHHRDGLGAGGGELVDLLDGHAQVVEPLVRDLLAGRLLDGLAGVVAGRVGVQGVDPDDDLVLRLVLEVRLAVDRPGQQPAGVAGGHDAAGDHLAGEGVALGDLLDVAGDALVPRRHGAGLPLRLGDVRAEDIRVAEGLVLRRDLAPPVPCRGRPLLERGRAVVASSARARASGRGSSSLPPPVCFSPATF